MSIYFVSGTDTSCGKTHVTGLLAKNALAEGFSVITQKLVQTGCEGISEDILAHRKTMGIQTLPEDLDGTSCPYVFKYPASPHLAAKLEKVQIDENKIFGCTKKLQSKYDKIFIEGAGGLCVPLRSDYLIIDFIAEKNLPLILVASSKLGSINHAILSIDMCFSRGLDLQMLAFNNFPDTDKILAEESANYIKNHLLERYPNCIFKEF